MTINYFAISASIFAGLATAFGAVPIYLKKEFSKDFLDMGLGFSAGVMLVAAFFSLLIPGLQSANFIYGKNFAMFPVVIGVLFGYLSIIFIHNWIPHEHLIKDNDMVHDKSFTRVTLIVLAIVLHNFPEGLAVGVSFGNPQEANGFTVALAMALQNMPEGLVVALGLLSVGASKNKAFMMALLSGLVEPISALFGYLATQITSYILPITMGFAAGAMLFVICQEIFPEIFREGHEKKTTFGVISGIVLMLMLDQLMKIWVS